MSEQISVRQLLALFVVSRLSLTLINYGADPQVRQDVWWENGFDALLTVAIAWLLNRLWQRFPQQTLTQVARTVLGQVAGRLVALLCALALLLSLSLTLRLTAEVFLVASLPATPISMLMFPLTAVAVWSVRSGLEVLGRTAEVIFPIVTGSVLVVFLLLLKDIRFEQLLPLEILSTGPLPHLRSMVGVVARTVELFSVGMLVPFVRERSRLLRTVVMAETWLAVIWVIMAISIIGILTGDFQAYPFPWYVAARSVAPTEFLERLDGLVLAVWVLGIYIRVALLLWTTTATVADALGVREYRTLVSPVAVLAVAYAFPVGQSMPEVFDLLRPAIFTPFGLSFVVLLPIALLLLAWVRGLRAGPASRQQSARGTH
jgi:spore germination protein KB